MTICLNMIVKNESKVIERCLASVRPFIDSWLIVDTGSTDGSQDLIREALKDLPGELHERPWVSFGHNRTQAIQLAMGKADYLLIIDADEVLKADEGFQFPELTEDSYKLKTILSGTSYYRTQLVRSTIPWYWVGVLHEYIWADVPFTQGQLEGLVNYPTCDGARSLDPLKFHKDAELLENALKTEPNNERYWFYLGQSYRDSGQNEKAIWAYGCRAKMGGWPEEVYFSLYRVAQIMNFTPGYKDEQIVEAYLKAYSYRPSRLEPLTDLARHYRLRNDWGPAYAFAVAAAMSPPTTDILFVDQASYDWRPLDELGIALYYLGRHEESAKATKRLLDSGKLPLSETPRVLTNLAFAEGRIP